MAALGSSCSPMRTAKLLLSDTNREVLFLSLIRLPVKLLRAPGILCVKSKKRDHFKRINFCRHCGY